MSLRQSQMMIAQSQQQHLRHHLVELRLHTMQLEWSLLVWQIELSQLLRIYKQRQISLL
jgi:hypothetical protein